MCVCVCDEVFTFILFCHYTLILYTSELLYYKLSILVLGIKFVDCLPRPEWLLKNHISIFEFKYFILHFISTIN